MILCNLNYTTIFIIQTSPHDAIKNLPEYTMKAEVRIRDTREREYAQRRRRGSSELSKNWFLSRGVGIP